MRIRIIVPNRTLLDAETDKITAPGRDGSFQILPRHVDVASSLEAGILTVTRDGIDEYYAINQGVLVKQGDTVHVSCFHAIRGTSLELLKKTVTDSFKVLDEKEKKLNQILTKLETDMLIMFMELD